MSSQNSAVRKQVMRKPATAAGTYQQQTFFFNRPALPSQATEPQQPTTQPRQLKPPSPHSPLAKQQASTAEQTDATPADLLQSLQQQIRKLETSSRREDIDTVSTGCTALDQLLPERGLVRGTIVEWLADGPGSSAAALALIAAGNACYETGSATPTTNPTATDRNRQIGTLIVVDPQKSFYPPGAAAWGIDLKNTIVLRPENTADQNWALQQALNCPAVAAVWAIVDELDERSFRRFQLAAEQSSCLGLFQRPASVRHQPSWSEIQLAIRPLPTGNSTTNGYRGRRLQVELLKCRGAANGRRIELEINEATGAIRPAMPAPIRSNTRDITANQTVRNHETHPRHLAAKLADPKADRRTARA